MTSSSARDETPSANFHHIEIWLDNPRSQLPTWRWLLQGAGLQLSQAWEEGESWVTAQGAYLTLTYAPLVHGHHDRRRPGVNHLALALDSAKRVDELMSQASSHGWRPLYHDRYPHAGGPDHYAGWLENAQGFKMELVAPASDISALPLGPAAATDGENNAGVITVSAVVVRRADGCFLHARKEGAEFFLFPGGKPEPGETPLETAAREFAEETGLRVDPALFVSLGHRRTRAANEAGFTLEADIFAIPAGVIPDAELAALVPHAEICELAWVDPACVDVHTGMAQAQVVSRDTTCADSQAPLEIQMPQQCAAKTQQVALAPLSRGMIPELARLMR